MALFRETALGPRPIARGGAKSIIVPEAWIFETRTYTCPKDGLYTAYGWSGGAMGSNGYRDGEGVQQFGFGGAAGNFARKTVRMRAGQQIACTVGKGARPEPSFGTSTAAGSTSITFFDGATNPSVVIPAPTSARFYNPGPRPTGGDINLVGGAGGLNSGTQPTAGEGSYAGALAYNNSFSGGSGSAPGDVILRGGNGLSGMGVINSGLVSGSLGIVTPGSFPGGGAPSLYSEGFTYGASRGGDGLIIVIYGEPRV